MWATSQNKNESNVSQRLQAASKRPEKHGRQKKLGYEVTWEEKKKKGTTRDKQGGYQGARLRSGGFQCQDIIPLWGLCGVSKAGAIPDGSWDHATLNFGMGPATFTG